MIQDPVIRFLLLPVSLLFGLGVSLRDFLYRRKLLISVSFNLPVISVGNLTVGGAGKTPHVEYLIRLLRPYLNVATLSRGYGRKTSGFSLVKPFHTAEDVGDEPLMFQRKFPDLTVSVCENRALGIPQIIQHQPATQVILLDDAFQHRSVLPGLNILLTEFSRPFTRDFMMPTGRLREWKSAYRRADLIIVTKCPDDLTDEQRCSLLEEIKPFPNQQVFFSSYRYGKPYYLFNPNYLIDLQENISVLLACGIAGTDYLQEFLEPRTERLSFKEFSDHHYFEETDLEEIERYFAALDGSKKIILTTEKDAARLELHRNWLVEKKLPVFVLPAYVDFLKDDKGRFDEAVKGFLLEFKV